MVIVKSVVTYTVAFTIASTPASVAGICDGISVQSTGMTLSGWSAHPTARCSATVKTTFLMVAKATASKFCWTTLLSQTLVQYATAIAIQLRSTKTRKQSLSAWLFEQPVHKLARFTFQGGKRVLGLPPKEFIPGLKVIYNLFTCIVVATALCNWKVSSGGVKPIQPFV